MRLQNSIEQWQVFFFLDTFWVGEGDLKPGRLYCKHQEMPFGLKGYWLMWWEILEVIASSLFFIYLCSASRPRFRCKTEPPEIKNLRYFSHAFKWETSILWWTFSFQTSKGVHSTPLFLPRALVAQLAPFGVSKGDIQGSNPPFRVVTIELLNKGNDNWF